MPEGQHKSELVLIFLEKTVPIKLLLPNACGQALRFGCTTTTAFLFCVSFSPFIPALISSHLFP